jgi:cytidylate kinase
MTAKRIITIDGPAGSGKSSAAERLAERLSGICLNSGSFYRIVANELIFAGVTTGETTTVDPNDEAAVMQCVTDITIEAENGMACRIGGRQVPAEGLRSQLVDDIVSAVSRHQALREYVNHQQDEVESSRRRDKWTYEVHCNVVKRKTRQHWQEGMEANSSNVES